MIPTLDEYVEDAVDEEVAKYEDEFDCDFDFEAHGGYIDEVRAAAVERYRELYTMSLDEQLEYSEKMYPGLR